MAKDGQAFPTYELCLNHHVSPALAIAAIAPLLAKQPFSVMLFVSSPVENFYLMEGINGTFLSERLPSQYRRASKYALRWPKPLGLGYILLKPESFGTFGALV